MINPINNIPPSQPAGPQSENPLLERFYALWVEFQNDPSKVNALAFYNFINDNQTELTNLANQSDLPPNPGANWEDIMQGAKTALIAVIQGDNGEISPAIEFLGDMRQWLGINVTAQDVEAGFESMVTGFFKDPSYMANYLTWILSTPGYLKRLASLAKDPAQFEKDVKSAYNAIQQYQDHPNNPIYLQNAEKALLKLESDLKS